MTGAKIQQLDHVAMVWDRQTGVTTLTVRPEGGEEVTYTIEQQRFVMVKTSVPDPPQYMNNDGLMVDLPFRQPPSITVVSSPNPIVNGGLIFE